MKSTDSSSSPTGTKTNNSAAAPWFALRRLGPREVDHELIWGVVGAGGLALCWTGGYWRGFVPVCPFKAMTGLPCPMCGGTRAAIAWAHLDFVGAFRMNPLVGAGAAVFSIYWFYAVGALMLRTRRIRVDSLPDPLAAWILRGTGALALLANWVYLVRAGR